MLFWVCIPYELIWYCFLLHVNRDVICEIYNYNCINLDYFDVLYIKIFIPWKLLWCCNWCRVVYQHIYVQHGPLILIRILLNFTIFYSTWLFLIWVLSNVFPTFHFHQYAFYMFFLAFEKLEMLFFFSFMFSFTRTYSI